MLGQECKHNRFDRGITILEALVSTAIIAIGFIAIFQMVQYSIRSIDVSGERTNSGLLISMVAEDLISEKNASSPTSKVSLTDYLINQITIRFHILYPFALLQSLWCALLQS